MMSDPTEDGFRCGWSGREEGWAERKRGRKGAPVEEEEEEGAHSGRFQLSAHTTLIAPKYTKTRAKRPTGT